MPFQHRCAAPLLALLLAAPALAGDGDVREATLENGLRVVVMEDHSSPIAAVQVWYRVGSKDEDPERQGFAHMFEHMMFRGTDRLGPKDHFEYVRGTGGDCNAFTSFDNTTYVQEVPSNQVPMVLWLEAERMAALKVDEAGFATERAVVEEEARLGQNQPYGTVMERVLEQVFREHPYRWSPIGRIDHLRAASSEELLRFWETYYVPNNAVLVVVGDVDAEEVVAEADRAFGWIPSCPEPPRVGTVEPLPGEPLEIELEEPRGPAPIVAAAWRTVPRGHDDTLALELLMSVLGGGESSRLHRRVVDEAEAAVMAAAGAFGLEQDGIAAAGALAMPFSDVDAALALIEEEVTALQADGPTEAELAKARANALAALVEESRTVASKANALGEACLFHGGPRWLEGRKARIEAVTADELKRVATEYLVPERRITIRVKPTLGGMLRTLLGGLRGGAAAPAPDAKPEEAPPVAASGSALERRGPKASALRPEGHPERPPRAELVTKDVPIRGERQVLDNGLEVVVVANHEVPRVGVRLGLKDGGYGEAKPGAASFAAQMLVKGTRGRDAQAIALALESEALSLSADASLDSASVTGAGPSDKLALLLGLLAEVVQAPTFPEKEFEKLKRQALTALAIAEKAPESIAEREFARALYGEFPYARAAGATSAQVKALSAAECAAWWRSHARPDRAVLYVAGDAEPKRVFALAEALFSDWEARAPAARPEAAADPEAFGPEAAPTRVVLVDVPGAIQSQIRAGHRGPRRADPDYAPLRVLSQVFGGAFNSRLNESLRVQKGLTYGASGGFSPSRFDGRFVVSTFSKTASTADAVRALIAEVVRMREEPPTPLELDQARSFLVGSFAGAHETPEAIAATLWSQALNGLGEDAAQRYLQDVVATTADDVLRLARERIDPERLTIVVVGDASKILAELETIAPVTLLDQDGEPKAKPAAGAGRDEEADEDEEDEEDGAGGE